MSFMKLLAISGDDENSNGIKDIVERRFNSQCSFELASTATKQMVEGEELKTFMSYTSPASIEGRAAFFEMMKISGGIAPKRGAGNRWYADCNLDAAGETDVTVSFQNGGKTISKSIVWAPTDITTAGNITIRKGDSLLFSRGNMVSDVSAVLNGKPLSISANSTLPVTFDEAGIHTVTASFRAEDGTEVNNSFTIAVLDYQLPQETQLAIVGVTRSMALNAVPEGIEFEADARLGFKPQQPRTAGYTMQAPVNEEFAVVARVKSTGQIISSFNLQGVNVWGADESTVRFFKKVDADTYLAQTYAVASPVMESGQIVVDIFIPGVVGFDGTTRISYGINELNSRGYADVFFLKTGEAWKTAACHRMEFYQDGEYVGRIYK